MALRKIIHVDMDAFYASVEQRDDPELRGKPVIVAWKGNRSVVCAASYEARTSARAQRLCPNGIFVPPDFPRYRAVSKKVHEIFKRHTGLIEPLSLDEAYLDVTENKAGLPTATLVARTIREQIRQESNLTASAGVAPYTLAEALHVRTEQVQKWIDWGWLRCRIVQTGRLKKEIIDAADFCEFCKHHRAEIVGRRLNSDRLNFVQTFVFPPSHMELLTVREAKKEQAEYEVQMKKEDSSVAPEFEPENILGITA